MCLCFYYNLLKLIRSVNKVHYNIIMYSNISPHLLLQSRSHIHPQHSICFNYCPAGDINTIFVILFRRQLFIKLMVFFSISQNEKIVTKPSDQVHLAMMIDTVARLIFPSVFVMFLAFFFFYYSVNANNLAISVGTDWTNCRRSQRSRSYHKGSLRHLHHNPLRWPDKNATQNEGSTVMINHVSFI